MATTETRKHGRSAEANPPPIKTRELTLTRVFNAPRNLVFQAWTEKHHLERWWGPKDFTNPLCKVDVRPGGSIRIDMRGPDGTLYPMGGTFHEIVPPEKLVFTATAFAGPDGKPELENLNTVTFEEHNGKTQMTLYVVVKRATPSVGPALEGMEQGWSESLDKLAELLARS